MMYPIGGELKWDKGEGTDYMSVLHWFQVQFQNYEVFFEQG